MIARMLTAATLFALAAWPLTALSAPTPPITDPKAFIANVYHGIHMENGYGVPDDVFTPHLAALFADMDRDTPKGEVGRLDFYFWVNGNDWELKEDAVVTAEPVEGNPGRQVITAKFVTIGHPQEMHFYFQRVGHRWLIDEVRSALPDMWTLSTVLKYGYDGPIEHGAGFEDPPKP